MERDRVGRVRETVAVQVARHAQGRDVGRLDLALPRVRMARHVRTDHRLDLREAEVEPARGGQALMLIPALAALLDLSFRRVQFTSDLLPQDVLGVHIFDAEKRGFTFSPGPLFANIVLADEINRSNPRAQSALLEAMDARGIARFVFSSSATVYGAPERLPLTEDSPIRPVNPYGHTKAMVEQVMKAWGKIDILVNNAGITRDGLLLRMKEEDWNLVLQINLNGTFNCTKAVLQPMTKQRYGRIVNIASIVGAMGNAGQANYAASKAAVIGFTKTVGREYASRNVTVNAVAPGFIDTEMARKLPEPVIEAAVQLIPMRRMGTVEEVARAVAFLASDAALFITGAVLAVDGGLGI